MRRALDLEVVAVVVMKLLQRLDDEVVRRHPDGPAPIRVAAEKAALGFGRSISDFMRQVAAVEAVGSALIDLREGADAVITQEFCFIEHPAQEAFHAMPAQDREHAPIT